jgi:hypothetical protein
MAKGSSLPIINHLSLTRLSLIDSPTTSGLIDGLGSLIDSFAAKEVAALIRGCKDHKYPLSHDLHCCQTLSHSEHVETVT